MQCHQPFCGNGQTYGYNVYNAPPNSSLSSQIVGEGDVTSVTLPDGSLQFFFIPKVKWWPHAANTCPYYTNAYNANNPYCGQYGTNLGAWFVRTITNSAPAAFPNPTCHECPRYEAPPPFHSSDCSFNATNNGYQLKFHSDHCTSTTDIHYFFPRLRQLDCTLALPARGCAAVQVTTPTANNTVCHYEIACSKPCHCVPKHCSVPATRQTASAMSLEDTISSPREVICDCNYDTFGKTKKSDNKRSSNGNKFDKSSSKDILCECDDPLKQKPNRSNTKIGSKAGDCDCIIPSFGKPSNTSIMSLRDSKSTSNECFWRCDSLVKDKLKCVCGSICRKNAMPLASTKTTSNETISECLPKSKKSHDTKSRSDEIICKCAQFLSKRNKSKRGTYDVNTKRKDKCDCCSERCLKYRKNKSSEVICECAQSLPKLKCNGTCHSKKSKRNSKAIDAEIICECAQYLTKLKCDGKCHLRNSKPKEDEIICECAQYLTKSKCNGACNSNKAKRHSKPVEEEIICECAQYLAKLKCDSTCKSNKAKWKSKPKEDEIICECAQYLSKSKCDATCNTNKAKKKSKPKEEEIICECAQYLAKLKCDGICNSNKAKPKEEEIICECAQYLTERKSDYMCYSKKTESKSKAKGKYDRCPCEVICECAESLAKREKSDCGCLYDLKDITEVTCECAESLNKERELKSECECCDCDKKSMCCLRCTGDDIQMQLLPTDGRRKRIKLDRRPQTANERKSKDVICESIPPPCSSKSLATYSDQSCGAGRIECIMVDRSTQCFCEEDTSGTKQEDNVYRCSVVNPEIWSPVTALSRKRFPSPRYNNNTSSCSSSTCTSDTDEGKNK